MRGWRILIVNRPLMRWPGIRSLLLELGLTLCAPSCSLACAAQQVGLLKPDLVLLGLSRLDHGTWEQCRALWRQLPGQQLLLLTACNGMNQLKPLPQGQLGNGLAEAGETLALLTSPALPRRHGVSLAALLLHGLLPNRTLLRARPGAAAALTPRELEVIRLVSEGRTSKAVAHQLGISLKTVETHRANLMRKLRLHSVGELVRYAIRHHLVHP